ncbi:vomeronasal type-2 receptor 26-like [Protopterus annectens]|uniref:vomeronasal type-2 receptor 26-like n=1 Tax=Protopterus annectens TaxID=7888 RepID=UPI001CF93373|nr:vomeronasal type-2 receptor 26-like [Protopterus annectens]
MISSFQFRSYRDVLAFVFAIEEINQSSRVLPNVTLGYKVYDSCSSEARALEGNIWLLTGKAESVPNFSCYQGPSVMGIVGDSPSRISVAMSRILGLYLFPQVLDYLKRVSFKTSLGEEIFFDKNGDPPAMFDIVNWTIYPDGNSKSITIGNFNSQARTGEEIAINASSVTWHPRYSKVPLSVCTESCPVGYRKATKEGKAICCFDCIPCSKGEIANESDTTDCLKCPKDQWSTGSRDLCIPKTIEFLSFVEPLGAALATMSVTLSFITASILCIFIYFSDTPIVKANNRGLSYLLLSSIIICFLCALIFIGKPEKESCMFRQVAFGIMFSLSVSCLLAKTTVVVIAFNASKPNGSLQNWVGSRFPYFIVLFCSAVQLILCIFWLGTSTPFVEYNMESEDGKILIQCNEGSLSIFYCMLGYLGFLVIVCFVAAFLARQLPDSFNEAKFITFSMLVFVSVWLSFIPAYLSTKVKYMVAVEVFAILASGAGLLICIFIPKCYIILLRPQLNTKEHLMGKAGSNNKKNNKGQCTVINASKLYHEI